MAQALKHIDWYNDRLTPMQNDSRTNHKPLLEIRALRTFFHTAEGDARAVDALDLVIEKGEIVGLVGESGSGKTVTALSILGLIPPPGKQTGGEIYFDGLALHALSDAEWSAIRGSRIAMIFQDPKIRLNPVFSIGTQIAEILMIHRGLKNRRAWAHMLELLQEVNLEDLAYAYPHELSMGQAQRVMIAMALALEPDLLIADEPTSSLDATIQAQILDLIQSQQREKGTAVLLISHNLAIVAQLARRVIVLYAGHVLEEAPVEALFRAPHHPYTQGLITSIPYNQPLGESLHTIPGSMPDARDLPPACRFAPRCKARKTYGLEICDRVEPDLLPVAPDHSARCWLYHSKGDHRAPLHPERT
jgi:oligopeptide/dipeptide ABC transporter ATP-binding protein